MAYTAPSYALGTPTPMRGVSSWAVGSARSSYVPRASAGSPKDLVPLPDQDALRDPLLHGKIRKSFAGQWYYGQVVKIDADANTGERFYHVSYEDNDEEHLTGPEVQAFLHQGSHVPARNPRMSGPSTPLSQSFAAGFAASVAASRRISFNASGPTPRPSYRPRNSMEGAPSRPPSLAPLSPPPAMHMHDEAVGGGFGFRSVVVALAALAVVWAFSACRTCAVGSFSTEGLSDNPILPSEYSWPEQPLQPSSWFSHPAPVPVPEPPPAPVVPAVLPDWVTQLPPAPTPAPVKLEPLASEGPPQAFSFESGQGAGFGGFGDLGFNLEEKLESNFGNDTTAFVGLALLVLAVMSFVASILVEPSAEAGRSAAEDLSASPGHMPGDMPPPLLPLDHAMDAAAPAPRDAPPTPAGGFNLSPPHGGPPAVASDPYVAPAEQSGAERLAALLHPERAAPAPATPGLAASPPAGMPGLAASPPAPAMPGLTASPPAPAMPALAASPPPRLEPGSVREPLSASPFNRQPQLEARVEKQRKFKKASLQKSLPRAHVDEEELVFQEGIVNRLITGGPRFRYGPQLRRFKDMGFEDTDSLRKALEFHRGDFNLALSEITLAQHD